MNRFNMRRLVLATAIGIGTIAGVLAQEPAGAADAKKQAPKRPPKPGVTTPGVQRLMSALTPDAVFAIPGTPDWQVVTDDAIWVANGPKNTIHRLDVKTNQVTATIDVGLKPCSGLTAGFGSIWVPLCGDKALARVDTRTNKVTTKIPIGPAESEGLVAASDDAVWMLTDMKGVLSRFDPKTNKEVAKITVPEGSVACYWGDGAIWVTTPEKNLLTRVDPRTNKAVASISVGPGPRFLTAGGGAVWTLNQGDGTVSRVDTKTNKLIANIPAGIPGTGGEIAFGNGHVWATAFQIPISEIDPATNTVVRQWVGAGGDSIRVAHGSVWLSNLREQNLWRIDLGRMQ